jgi:hypothetical protein
MLMATAYPILQSVREGGGKDERTKDSLLLDSTGVPTANNQEGFVDIVFLNADLTILGFHRTWAHGKIPFVIRPGDRFGYSISSYRHNDSDNHLLVTTNNEVGQTKLLMVTIQLGLQTGTSPPPTTAPTAPSGNPSAVRFPFSFHFDSIHSSQFNSIHLFVCFWSSNK